MEIRVVSPRRTIALRVAENHAIRDVRRMVDEAQVSTAEYALVYNKRPLKDEQRVFDCGITHKSALFLLENYEEISFISFTIRYYESTILVTKPAEMTFSQFKLSISDHIGLYPYQIRIFHSEKEVPGHLTLSDFFASNSLTIDLQSTDHVELSNCFSISAKTLKGKTFTLKVEESTTIEQVKMMRSEITYFGMKSG